MRTWITSILVFPLMIAFNIAVFRVLAGKAYVLWFIDNGGIASALAAMFAVALPNINSNQLLISSNPRAFLRGHIELLASQLLLIAEVFEPWGSRLQRRAPEIRNGQRTAGSAVGRAIADLCESLAALIATTVLLVSIALWFVSIVPLQYFIILIAGAPSRLALKLSESRAFNSATEPARTADMTLRNSFVSAPVSAANAIAALVLTAAKWSISPYLTT